MKPKLTRCTFILALASVAAIGLVLIILTPHKLPQIKGSLSEDDARAILKELHRWRWWEANQSLTNGQFRFFWRYASENFRLRFVSVEGDTTHAIIRCRDRDRSDIHVGHRPQGVTYEFTNNNGGWSFTSVTHWIGFDAMHPGFELDPTAKKHEATTHQPP